MKKAKSLYDTLIDKYLFALQLNTEKFNQEVETIEEILKDAGYEVDRGFLVSGQDERQQTVKITTPDGEVESYEVYKYVTIVLADNLPDKDFERFTGNALVELALKSEGHSVYFYSGGGAFLRGEIIEAWTENGDDGVNRAKAKVFLHPSILANLTDFKSGEPAVSISCSVERRCSICGAKLNKDKCEHMPSLIYNGKTCISEITSVYDFFEAQKF